MAVDVTNDLKMIIDGVAVGSTSGRWIEVRSPATGELVGRVPDGTEADVDRAVPVARASFNDGRWHRMGMPDRVTIMNRLGDLLDGQVDNAGTVQLSLRADAQQVAKFLLGGRTGSIVVMEPATGAVRVMAAA